MLKKLLPHYTDAIFFTSKPSHPYEGHYLFYDDHQNESLAIPKNALEEAELELLKTLFQLIEPVPQTLSTEAALWNEFLLNNGPGLKYNSDDSFRFIQFSLKDSGIDPLEIESALKGFFSEDVMIIWENALHGVVIEEKKMISLAEKDIINLSETLESDFYVRISFYIGKIHPYTEKLPELFQQEKKYFHFGQKYLQHTHIFTFERIFPSYIAGHLPAELKLLINQEIKEALVDDAEMFATIKVFLENNLNASVTAKKLYIHRNTLQYRIDKFVEKTGIGFKDFYGAFTVFLACLIVEQDSI